MSVCSNILDVNLSFSECGSELLEMLVYGLKSVEYGGGSIDGLKLSHSAGGCLVQLPHQIHQHLRILDLGRCRLHQAELDILVDYVPHLHSLTSLDISGNPGGVGSTVKLLQALKQLGKLETLNMTNSNGCG